MNGIFVLFFVGEFCKLPVKVLVWLLCVDIRPDNPLTTFAMLE